MVPLAWCRLKISGRAPGPSSLYGLTAPNGPPSLGGGGRRLVGSGGARPPIHFHYKRQRSSADPRPAARGYDRPISDR